MRAGDLAVSVVASRLEKTSSRAATSSMSVPLLKSRLFQRTLAATTVPAGIVLVAFAFRDGFSWVWTASAVLATGLSLGLAVWWGRDVLSIASEIELLATQVEADVRLPDRARDVPAINWLTGASELDSAGRSVVGLSRAACERVDELERRQKILEQDSTLLQGVLGTMQEGVLVIDADERLRYVNVAGQWFFDIGSRDAFGRYAWESIRNLALQEMTSEVLKERKPLRREIAIARRKRIVAVSAVPLPDELGQGVLAVAHDVTELRRLERMRREFVSNVSHELKTPLTSIQAFTETLLDGAIDDPANNRGFLEQILTQAERLQTLILDMLRLARIESEPEAFEIQEVSLAALIGECVRIHRPVADQAQVRLTAEQVDPDLAVLADPDGVRTILNNLVRNAIAYTPAGGEVEVAAIAAGGYAEIIVEDTGVGISREHTSRIFERFYRVDKARSRAAGGTGLGLAIVKHLTEVFHGGVEVSSELGKGSRFVVQLPLTRSAVGSV